MKLLFTLFSLVFLDVTVSAQAGPDLLLNQGISLDFKSLPVNPRQTIAFKPSAILNTTSEKPLVVIDGIPYESNGIEKLNPDDIASIYILKRDKLGVISCHSANRDVILITTKSIHTRKFIIKDFLTGEKIPAATVLFTSIKDTINAVADENGSLTTGKLKAGTTYDITVSSAGYKTFTTTVAGKEQEILLEREVKLCAEVIVIAYPGFGCGRTYTSISQKVTQCNWETIPDTVWSKVAMSTLSTPATNFFLYPNPVQRNGVFNLQLESKLDETIQLTVIGMSGTVVSLQSKKIRRGLNRLSVTADSKWAAGIYNIQLRNEKGTLVRQEKLVVQ